MSKLRVWIYSSVVMALMLTMGLLTLVATISLVQADVDPVVTFPDRNLEAAIRAAINRPVGDIRQSDLEELTEFSDETGEFANLTGLEHCKNLTSLYLRHKKMMSDISPLASLTNLTELDLSDNEISDISPLVGLTRLTSLNLMHNQIDDISPLAGLTNLTWLDLSYEQYIDLSPLAGLTTLTALNLWGNQISDISPLANLTGPAELSFGANEISDISPLASANLTGLRSLILADNQISDISPLASTSLTSPTELDLGANNISDIKPLVDNPGLGEGDYVHLRFNPLSDTSLNTYIPQLEARGVIVDYRDVSGWCFIATAAYGTPMAEEIQMLRKFRDEYLLTNPLGRSFVDFYYSVSPSIAEFITEHPSLQPLVRGGLVPAVAISALVVNTTPYEKTAMLGFLVLVSVAPAVWVVRW